MTLSCLPQVQFQQTLLEKERAWSWGLGLELELAQDMAQVQEKALQQRDELAHGLRLMLSANTSQTQDAAARRQVQAHEQAQTDACEGAARRIQHAVSERKHRRALRELRSALAAQKARTTYLERQQKSSAMLCYKPEGANDFRGMRDTPCVCACTTLGTGAAGCVRQAHLSSVPSHYPPPPYTHTTRTGPGAAWSARSAQTALLQMQTRLGSALQEGSELRERLVVDRAQHSGSTVVRGGRTALSCVCVCVVV